MLKIEVFAETEDITPERSEKLHGFAPGFAKAVKDVKKRAKGKWGWCTAVVRVTTKEGTAEESLGGCSYESDVDFIQNSGYFMDMVGTCLAEIEKGVQRG